METRLIDCDYTQGSVSEHDQHPAEDGAGLKQCPYCAERIQTQAIKCRYCGEFLEGAARPARPSRPAKWYFATGTVVMALLCLGPLALPLVWLNPRYKPLTRTVITIVVLAVTVLGMYLVSFTYRQLLSQISALGM